MKKTLQIILSFIFTALAVSTQLSAQTNENWDEVNLAVIDHQVIPQYADLEAVTKELAIAARSFCIDINTASFENFQQSYHLSMDAWQSIQHLQFGPITYFNWNFRLQYWPDEKGIGSRQLNSLIATQGLDALSERNFPRQSVGIQGFPALESLLFSQDSFEDLQNDSYRCQLVETIAENISIIANSVHARWGDEYRETVANAADSDEFESAEDATIDLLKALVESVPRIMEQKITPILGSSFEASRLRRAESWRSARSLRNLKINIRSLGNLFDNSNGDEIRLSSVFEAEDVAAIKQTFTDIDLALNTLPDSLAKALENEDQYAAMENVQLLLQELDDLLEDALKNTDLYLGFNSLDGD